MVNNFRLEDFLFFTFHQLFRAWYTNFSLLKIPLHLERVEKRNLFATLFYNAQCNDKGKLCGVSPFLDLSTVIVVRHSRLPTKASINYLHPTWNIVCFLSIYIFFSFVQFFFLLYFICERRFYYLL